MDNNSEPDMNGLDILNFKPTVLKIVKTIDTILAFGKQLNNTDINEEINFLQTRFDNFNFELKIILNLRLENIILYNKYESILPCLNLIYNDICELYELNGALLQSTTHYYDYNYSITILRKLINIINGEINYIMKNGNDLLETHKQAISNYMCLYTNNNLNSIDNIHN
jgi:hypothetical protein